MTRTDVAPGFALSRLVARSEGIDPPSDLLEHLGADGFAWLDGDDAFVTAGVVAVVPAATAHAALAAMQHVAAPGAPAACGPRAVGALPFAGDGMLTIPARIVGRDASGAAWCTVVDGADAGPTLRLAQPAPATFRVTAATNAAAWRAMVDDALRRIRSGALTKVVLARTATVEADRAWDARDVLRTLVDTQPGCVAYADGNFVGASPELLVRKHGTRVISRPLAGTGVDAAALSRSAKNTHEHALVADAVVDALRTVCDDVMRSGTETLQLASVVHLLTTVTGIATAGIDVVDVVRALHPTPAVAGTPRVAALDTIAELEPVGRDRYAGPCGWVDATGDGAFVVALRGGELRGERATLWAGAGIVEGSDPDAEWRETQQKLTPMLQALVRP